MTTPAKKKRSPYFTTEVDIEIDPHDLEEAGWVFVGDKDDKPLTPSEGDAIRSTVRRWHDQAHPDAWRFCFLEPCRDIPKGDAA
jgi:hypothetical protein